MAKKTKKEIMQEKYNELAKLFGATTGRKTGVACRGKYRGTTDYSVTFDNGGRFYISNGMAHFEETLDGYIAEYKGFTEIKNELLDVMRTYEQRDKERAEEHGLLYYHILDVDYIRDTSYEYFGWYYLTLELSDGAQHRLMTTNIKYAIKRAIQAKNPQEFLSENGRPYSDRFWRAGACNEGAGNFVFYGIEYSKNLYTPR